MIKRSSRPSSRAISLQSLRTAHLVSVHPGGRVAECKGTTSTLWKLRQRYSSAAAASMRYQPAAGCVCLRWKFEIASCLLSVVCCKNQTRTWFSCVCASKTPSGGRRSASVMERRHYWVAVLCGPVMLPRFSLSLSLCGCVLWSRQAVRLRLACLVFKFRRWPRV